MNPITPAACSKRANPLKKSNIFVILVNSFSPNIVKDIETKESLQPMY